MQIHYLQFSSLAEINIASAVRSPACMHGPGPELAKTLQLLTCTPVFASDATELHII